MHTHTHTHIRDNSNDDASIWFLIIICPWYSDTVCACSLYMYMLNRTPCDDEHHSSSLFFFFFLFSNVIQIDALYRRNERGLRWSTLNLSTLIASRLQAIYFPLVVDAVSKKKHFLFCRILCKKIEENGINVSRSCLSLSAIGSRLQPHYISLLNDYFCWFIHRVPMVQLDVFFLAFIDVNPLQIKTTIEK